MYGEGLLYNIHYTYIQYTNISFIRHNWPRDPLKYATKTKTTNTALQRHPHQHPHFLVQTNHRTHIHIHLYIPTLLVKDHTSNYTQLQNCTTSHAHNHKTHPQPQLLPTFTPILMSIPFHYLYPPLIKHPLPKHINTYIKISHNHTWFSPAPASVPKPAPRIKLTPKLTPPPYPTQIYQL